MSGFRLRLLIGMMLVVCGVTALALWIAERKVTDDGQQQIQHAFQSEIAALHHARELRHAAVIERSQSLARKPRIHAALEDNALDLLYPNAADALRDVMNGDSDHPLQARFYRFLDAAGRVLPAPSGVDAGKLDPAEEAALSLGSLPGSQQIGYLVRNGEMDEIIAEPIISTETNEVIASIVLGFKPFDLNDSSLGMEAGIWTQGHFSLADSDDRHDTGIALALGRVPTGAPTEVVVHGSPHLVLSQLLNPGSLYPAAYEVCVYSFEDAVARRRHLRYQILGAGAFLLLGAGVASHLISGRLSLPVERLAVDSARNVTRREEAEAALEQTSGELHRSMRFSADTSHQLKTPITVLRAGLEELQKQPGVTREMSDDISALISQTSKLSSMIHDLLLLSRLDAGRLELQKGRIDLSHFIDSLVDDLSAIPGAVHLTVRAEVPQGIHVLGEKRYISMILQNLLENAWKYNLPDGTISITSSSRDGMLFLRIGNTGGGIPQQAQEHVFERFHRATVGENVPGHGLGLNIARELALLHGGDLRLIRSGDGWTEFEVSFPMAPASDTA